MTFSKKIISAVLFASMVCLPSALMAGDHYSDSNKSDKWLHQAGSNQAGDFHPHTYYTDGSNRFSDVMQNNSDKRAILLILEA